MALHSVSHPDSDQNSMVLAQMVKNQPAGDPGLIPGLGGSPGGGNGNPLQYSCLGNAMDRGAWRATVHSVAKVWTRLNRETGFPDSSVGKESACNAGDPRSIPGSGKSAGEGTGYPLQYSWAYLVAQLVKNPPAMQETWFGKIPWRREWLHTPVFWRIRQTV